jgi:hypothetical protein
MVKKNLRTSPKAFEEAIGIASGKLKINNSGHHAVAQNLFLPVG